MFLEQINFSKDGVGDNMDASAVKAEFKEEDDCSDTYSTLPK